MLIIQKIRWVVLAGAALVLSGCVAPPQSNAYNSASAQPEYSNAAPQYSQYAEPNAVYYEEPAYQAQQAYVEPYYYAPAYPVVGASFGYSIYDHGYYYRGNKKHAHKKHHRGVKKHEKKLKDKHKAGKKAGKKNGKRRAGKNRKQISAAKLKTILLLQGQDENHEGQRASDGNN
jgi:hypothetical protein